MLHVQTPKQVAIKHGIARDLEVSSKVSSQDQCSSISKVVWTMSVIVEVVVASSSHFFGKLSKQKQNKGTKSMVLY